MVHAGQTIGIDTVDDTIVEGPEDYTVAISGAFLAIERFAFAPTTAAWIALLECPCATLESVRAKATYLKGCVRGTECSWEDGAVLRDKANRIFADPARIHRVHHHGLHYRVDAIHLAEPSP